MEPKQALTFLFNALDKATLAGIFNLADTENIHTAIKTIASAIEPQPIAEALKVTETTDTPQE